jgi:hypothetical protein
LNLSSNQISPSFIEKYLIPFIKNSNIQILKLNGLKIGDDALEAASRMGAQYIADRFNKLN